MSYRSLWRTCQLFFRITTLELALILCAVTFGATGVGMLLGRRLRHRSEHLRDPFSAVQGALLGFVGLILAFGLALAVGRYEIRRAVAAGSRFSGRSGPWPARL